jgi:hypothetical protein
VTEARPASGLLVSALLRRVATAGGHGAVLSRGDATAGAILLILAERGVTRRLLERGVTPDGNYGWVQSGPKAIDDAAALSDYLARRRRNDPDLWVVELDAPEETLGDLTA